MIRFQGRCSWIVLALALIGAMGFGGGLGAQSSDAKIEAITRAIEERAIRDVEIERPPASISDLERLFDDQASEAGLSLDRVLAIYEEAYERSKPRKTWWQQVEPKVGWLTAGILLVLLVVRDQLTQALRWVFHRVTEAVYRRIAGLRPFWVLSLRRYRKSLARAYDQLKVPFRPGRPLRMQEIYVPLKISGSLDRTQVSIHSALSRRGAHLVILGAPGSGKSMLMKHLTLTYAVQGLGTGRGRRSPHSAIPVLLELHRLNESKPSEILEDHLAAALDRQNFPGGSSFLRAGLEKGMILLLLDGLDEVNQDARGRVVRQIKDLAKRSPACQIVVTCRKAVYSEEFSGWSDEVMEIVEFDDRQIEGFLAAWEPEMPEGKSVEHLLRGLRERPRIMALARNPLLLTIIAYLYSDTPFVLPHSRAEFYREATTVLLEQWDKARQLRNHYKAPHKRLVLQALALAFQRRGSERGQDRRSMPLASVLKEISAVLETLNLGAQDAEPLLEEMVERSGLLLALDSKTRYQFTHLSLQEFFAALALGSNEEVLIEQFRADPGTWREVAKLWCGLEHDSTRLLTAVADIDPVAALECLGDTQKVEKEFSDRLISGFLDSLDQAADDEEAAKALALVAADPRPRGEATYSRLVGLTAFTSVSERTSQVAARVLSLTSLPKAADHLADLAQFHQEFRPLLANMGNLAVPFLAERAEQSAEWAVDLLFQIGTPRAAEALVPLLWAENPNQWKVALYLGSLIANPQVEEALAELAVSNEQQSAERLDWIWAPFSEDTNASIAIVVGRIAFVLADQPNRDPSDWRPRIEIDPRLALALCSVRSGRLNPGSFPDSARVPALDESKSLVSVLPTSRASERDEDFILRKIEVLEGASPLWLFLLRSLPKSSQLELLRRRLQFGYSFDPSEEDWSNLLRPLKYSFSESLEGRGFRLGLVLLFVLVLISIGFLSDLANLPWLEQIVAVVAMLGIIMAIGITVLGKKLDPDSLGGDVRFAWLIMITPITGALLAGMNSFEDWAVVGLVIPGFIHLKDNFSDQSFPARDLSDQAVGRLTLLMRFLGFSAGLLVGGVAGVVIGTLVIALVSSAIEHFSGVVYNRSELSDALVGLIALEVVSIAFYYAIAWMLESWGGPLTTVFWSLSIAVLIGSCRRGLSQERRANNPLHGLLDPILTPTTATTVQPND